MTFRKSSQTIHIGLRLGPADNVGAMLSGAPPPAALEFAVAAGCLNHAIPGDFHPTGRA